MPICGSGTGAKRSWENYRLCLGAIYSTCGQNPAYSRSLKLHAAPANILLLACNFAVWERLISLAFLDYSGGFPMNVHSSTAVGYAFAPDEKCLVKPATH